MDLDTNNNGYFYDDKLTYEALGGLGNDDITFSAYTGNLAYGSMSAEIKARGGEGDDNCLLYTSDAADE